MSEFAQVPMRFVGPIKITGAHIDEEVSVPLATYESPLWPSVARGAKLSRMCGGIKATIVSESMTRSIALQAPDAARALTIAEAIQSKQPQLQAALSSKSRFTELVAIHHHIVGRTLYLRFSYKTGDASGHNMVTQASDDFMQMLLAEFDDLDYVSVSGNYCVDKKVSAVNSIVGRGKNVVAELHIPRAVCEKSLRTTPEALVDINIKKNLLGSIAAGSLCSANAHYANMLLGFYLATGQDAANIVEGSQGITHVELDDDGVYFSVTLPNIIIGSVGNGKHLEFVRDNLRLLGCDQAENPGDSARRLAAIAAATVLCGELSLLAALTNPGELMKTHQTMERKK